MATTGDMNECRAPARWNTLSVCAPLVGFLCGLAAALVAPHMQQGVWGFRVWFAFAAVGLLSGINSWVRGERWWGVTVVGFLLNLTVLVITWDLTVNGR